MLPGRARGRQDPHRGFLDLAAGVDPERVDGFVLGIRLLRDEGYFQEMRELDQGGR